MVNPAVPTVADPTVTVVAGPSTTLVAGPSAKLMGFVTMSTTVPTASRVVPGPRYGCTT
jgi:hypothetical protein